jgi:predicted DsbA family dithiol-disulfide isomerase
MQQVVLYKTFLCPRCFLAGRALQKLRGEFPELIFETVEVTRDPLRAWQAGVRMLPTVTYQGKTISGVILTTAALRDFLRP